MASISSMKTMEGACSSATRKSSRTSLGPSPRYFWISSEPTTRRKVAEVWLATALASSVLPACSNSLVNTSWISNRMTATLLFHFTVDRLSFSEAFMWHFLSSDLSSFYHKEATGWEFFIRNWTLNTEIPPGASVPLKTSSKRSDSSIYPPLLRPEIMLYIQHNNCVISQKYNIFQHWRCFCKMLSNISIVYNNYKNSMEIIITLCLSICVIIESWIWSGSETPHELWTMVCWLPASHSQIVAYASKFKLKIHLHAGSACCEDACWESWFISC